MLLILTNRQVVFANIYSKEISISNSVFSSINCNHLLSEENFFDRYNGGTFNLKASNINIDKVQIKLSIGNNGGAFYMSLFGTSILNIKST